MDTLQQYRTSEINHHKLGHMLVFIQWKQQCIWWDGKTLYYDLIPEKQIDLDKYCSWLEQQKTIIKWQNVQPELMRKGNIPLQCCRILFLGNQAKIKFAWIFFVFYFTFTKYCSFGWPIINVLRIFFYWKMFQVN